ncbi:hypothetical protein EDD91_7621, partial [Streptomyces sp. KS 21]
MVRPLRRHLPGPVGVTARSTAAPPP